jgi:hypothetical protein
MRYSKFVIVSHLRSGTHLLRTALESHPAIVCQTEVFNSDNPNLPYPLSTPTSRILGDWVFRNFSPEVERVGFVLQVYHPWGLKAFPGIRANPVWGDVWSQLAAMPDLRVIHLRRDNLLRRHLSHVMARKTGNWHAWVPDTVDKVTHLGAVPRVGATRSHPGPVRLDHERLVVDFEETEQLHRLAAERFSYHPVYSLSYEALCRDFHGVCDRVQTFLGVHPIRMTAAVTKLEQRSLAESIVNYDALKRRFSGSRWQAFFDDEDRSVYR